MAATVESVYSFKGISSIQLELIRRGLYALADKGEVFGTEFAEFTELCNALDIHPAVTQSKIKEHKPKVSAPINDLATKAATDWFGANTVRLNPQPYEDE